MTVDGVANTVEEVDVVGVETGDANPYGNAFTTRSTVIATRVRRRPAGRRRALTDVADRQQRLAATTSASPSPTS